jgi:hypothetical protein
MRALVARFMSCRYRTAASIRQRAAFRCVVGAMRYRAGMGEGHREHRLRPSMALCASCATA